MATIEIRVADLNRIIKQLEAMSMMKEKLEGLIEKAGQPLEKKEKSPSGSPRGRKPIAEEEKERRLLEKEKVKAEKKVKREEDKVSKKEKEIADLKEELVVLETKKETEEKDLEEAIASEDTTAKALAGAQVKEMDKLIKRTNRKIGTQEKLLEKLIEAVATAKKDLETKEEE